MSAARTKRGLTALVALVGVGAVVLGIGYAVTARPRPAALTADAVATGTAPVTRGTVTETVKLGGTLGYDGTFPVVNQFAPGIVTALPDPGSTVNRDGILYAVANRPVRLLYGAIPAYRGFAAGIPDGPDVAELETNLVALGLDPHRAITVDNRFTSATTDAIRRWQTVWGLPAGQRSGTLEPGQVVFLPGALRIGQVSAQVGTTIGPDAPVLTGTSANRVVTAPLTTDRQSLVHTGDQVRVSVAGTPPVTGTVSRIGRVAAAPASTSGSGSGAPSAPPSITVTIALTLPPGVADLDEAPAQIAITTAQHRDVLLVPVAALLARPGGGYQVQLTSGGYVEVRPGLFDEDAGTVEVDAPGLGTGQRVTVPAS
jgi:hypothetical protein